MSRRRSRRWALVAMAGSVVVASLCAAAARAPQDGKRPAGAFEVTLEARTGAAGYGSSAYSFRFLSADPAVHHDHVDLVYNGCGRLHVAPYGGLDNRVARVAAERLEDVASLPSAGWEEQCFEPEKGALYVLVVEDELTKMHVRFRIVKLTERAVTLECQIFRPRTGGDPGPMGRCGGSHGC